MSQITRIFFEVPLEFITLNQFLPELSGSGFTDCNPRNGAESVSHSISESINLLHIKVEWLDFFSSFLLTPNNFRKYFLVVLGGFDRCGFVLAVLGSWNNKRQRHASLTSSCCAANSMSVRARRCRQVKVQNTSNVVEVNSTRDSVIFVSPDCLALLSGRLCFWIRICCFCVASGRFYIVSAFFGFLFVAHNFVFIGSYDNIVDILVVFFDDVYS